MARSATVGIPNGRNFPLAFGMYTRRAGVARHGWYRSTFATSLLRPAGVFTTNLSTPGVSLPPLSCVTRRTLIRAFAMLRNINFCSDLTFFKSPVLDALKMRCRKLRTVPSACRQSTDCHKHCFSVTFARLALCI